MPARIRRLIFGVFNMAQDQSRQSSVKVFKEVTMERNIPAHNILNWQQWINSLELSHLSPLDACHYSVRASIIRTLRQPEIHLAWISKSQGLSA